MLSLRGPAALPLAEFERELCAELTRLRVSRRSGVNEPDAEDYLAAASGPFRFEEARAARLVVAELDLEAGPAELRALLGL